MMFVGSELTVALVTAHIGFAKVASALTQRGVLDTIRLLSGHLRTAIGIARPRIAVLGLNPHAGESGMFGDEEIRVIAPAIRRAQREDIDALGPVAPDTAFIRNAGAFNFDGAVAMYHDQGLIALKTLEFDRAVNVTLGLPFVRTSPDHGTAFDIAGKGVANPTAAILSAAMLLRLGLDDDANATRIERAVELAYAGGARTAERLQGVVVDVTLVRDRAVVVGRQRFEPHVDPSATAEPAGTATAKA